MDIEVKSLGIGLAIGLAAAFVAARFWKAIVKGTAKTVQRVIREVKETAVEPPPPAAAKTAKS